MKVMQLLPELNSGGVERGTLEIAKNHYQVCGRFVHYANLFNSTAPILCMSAHAFLHG